MTNYEQLLQTIQLDERYQRNLDWGRSRKGHPEGTIREHIRALEGNLRSLGTRLPESAWWKLKVLIHIHDTFKPEATRGVPILDPRSHASLARQFLREYCDDADLLAILQYHDEPYALWKQVELRGHCDLDRFNTLFESISDWDLFLAFLIIDGCVEGKSRAPLIWFFGEIQTKGSWVVTLEWLL